MSDSSEAGHACHLSAQEQTASSPGHFLDGRGSGFETATRWWGPGPASPMRLCRTD